MSNIVIVNSGSSRWWWWWWYTVDAHHQGRFIPGTQQTAQSAIKCVVSRCCVVGYLSLFFSLVSLLRLVYKRKWLFAR